MTNPRILVIVFGVVALFASGGAAFLALSVFNNDEPAQISSEAQVNQPVVPDEPSATPGEPAAPLQTTQLPDTPQPRGFPTSPGEAANQSGIMNGKGFLKNQHGDWSELCQAASGPGADRCILVQNIESANRPLGEILRDRLGIEVGVLRLQGLQGRPYQFIRIRARLVQGDRP
ncbi:MAG: hypothetical protein ACC634_03975, partial [Hyphomicrobiales bacterium]